MEAFEVHPWEIGGRKRSEAAYMYWAIERPGTETAIAAVLQEDHAYLFAAAPDMLAALKAVRKWGIDVMGTLPPSAEDGHAKLSHIIDAAIAKAVPAKRVLDSERCGAGVE